MVIVMDRKCYCDFGFDTFGVMRKKSLGSRPFLCPERIVLLRENRLICVVMKLVCQEYDCLMPGMIGLLFILP